MNWMKLVSARSASSKGLTSVERERARCPSPGHGRVEQDFAPAGKWRAMKFWPGVPAKFLMLPPVLELDEDPAARALILRAKPTPAFVGVCYRLSVVGAGNHC